MIFVGINNLFRHFDTAYEHLNSQLPLASIPFFAVLIQHYPLEQANAGDFCSEEGRRADYGSHTKMSDNQKSDFSSGRPEDCHRKPYGEVVKNQNSAP